MKSCRIFWDDVEDSWVFVLNVCEGGTHVEICGELDNAIKSATSFGCTHVEISDEFLPIDTFVKVKS